MRALKSVKSILHHIGLLDSARHIHSSLGSAAHQVAVRLNGAAIGLRLGFDIQARTLPRNYRQRLLFVRPGDIKHRLSSKHWKRLRSSRVGFVLRGDWDTRLVTPATSDHSSNMLTVQQLFVEGVPPHQTAQYLYIKECLESGRSRGTRGSTTVEEIDRYFDGLIRVYERIRDEGYKSQRELGLTDEDEMRVYIDRHGGPIKGAHGHHRLQFARILGVEAIPAIVEGVHYLWAQGCFHRYGGNIRSAIEQGLQALDARPEASRYLTT